MLRHLLCTFLFSALCFIAYDSLASNKTGREVMQSVENQNKIHRNQRYDVGMVIIDKKNRERKRYFTSRQKYNSDINLGLVRFYKPADLKGTALLSRLPKTVTVARQWIYLPAFRSTKRLSNEDRNSSFMGSDFSNADIGGRHLDSDQHTLMSEDDEYYYVRSIPNDVTDAYGKIDYVIIKSINVVSSAKFYDKKELLIKILANKTIKKYKGMYIVVEALMSTEKTKSKTLLTISGIDVDTPKSDVFYSVKRLRD